MKKQNAYSVGQEGLAIKGQRIATEWAEQNSLTVLRPVRFCYRKQLEKASGH